MQSQTLALSRATTLQAQDRLDFARIGAFSAVIAIHVIAAGLLLAPMRMPDPGRIEQSVPITIVLPEVPPPPLVPVTVKPKVMPTPTKPIPQRQPEPRNNTVASNTTPIAASNNPEANTTVAKGDPTQPIEPVVEPNVEPKVLRGAQLAYASTPAPIYPRAAQIGGIEGTVILEVTVDEHGKPIDVVIAVSSGSRDLDRAAREQVLRAWRFQPAMESGRAVRAIGRVPVNFTLNR
ncbi:energy transducer TonB [Solilutibacter silvestris]|uniref:Protein TonB n=1 Tax=Solilutibacter silvestris TaxID=1645665 RepID=A0A2K1Q3D3_9GAMM|nr:energy transducer TonB [Lysobacter silvestris]PNS09523.1 TonB C-terminal domain-containing protein [Lysobacter silvestris]